LEVALFGQLQDVDWAAQFDQASVERGRRYAADDKVEPDWEVHASAAGTCLGGTVQGSGRRQYDTQVVVIEMRGRTAVLVHCSCPVGYQCKHGVALIQAFMEDMAVSTAMLPVSSQPQDQGKAVEQRWERWLELLAKAQQDTASVHVETGRQLGLFIDTESEHPLPRVLVAAVWLRPSKSKSNLRLVDPKAIQWIQDRLAPAPSDGWDPWLQEQLMLLLQVRSYPTVYGVRADFSRLSLPFHARVLQTLFETADGPVIFHGKQTGPRVQLGPRRTLRARWQSDSSGTHRLVAELEGGRSLSSQHMLALVGDDLWYLDPGTGVMGPVDGAPALAAWVKKAPTLPAEKVPWLTERMHRESGLPSGLEPPSALEIVPLPEVAPTLSMKVSVVVLEDRAWPPRQYELGSAQLSFEYHDLSLPEGDPATERIVRDGQLLTVARDRQAEQGLLDVLPEGLLRLDALTEHAGLPSPGEDAGMRLLNLADILPDSLEAMVKTLAAPQQWWPMINSLRQAGVRIEFSEDFPPEPQRLIAEDWHADLEPAGNGWFELGLDVEVDGERLDLLPVLRSLLADPDFPLTPPPDEPEDATWEVALDEERILVLPLARLRPLITPILDWLDADSDADSMRLPVTAATQLDTPAARWTGRGPAQIGELAQALAELPREITEPAGFRGSLRDYQAQGVSWLRWLSLLGLGGILADDMGLGKTVQVLAHISDERARTQASDPVLVVATTSLVSNWCAEAARFCPDLRVLPLQLPKAEREQALEQMADADLIVTTYPLLVRDVEVLKSQRFSLLVLDEAQAIKNAASQTAKAVRRLDAVRRLAMTGTPLENHLGELWAQIDAVAPGYLGPAQWFGQHFRRPIEQDGAHAPLTRLKGRIAPLMLRRTRDEVLGELPEKTESLRNVVLSGAQRDLYESLRLAQHRRVRQSIEQRGLAQSGIVMLDALLKLRQVCCDPRLVKLDSARRVQRSAKLLELRSLLATLLDEGRRVLVFSQFTEMLQLIADDLQAEGIPFLTLTGQVPGRERKQRIDRFQSGEVPVFLISLKAGGVGLNLTAADTVIHYDPWWNPAVEDQATGRAHRMGQTRPVMVYKLVCAGTVEERITELQQRKSTLAASILSQDGAKASGLVMDESELEALFAPLATS